MQAFDSLIPDTYDKFWSIDTWIYISLFYLWRIGSCCMKFCFCRSITVSSCWHCALIVLDKFPPFPTAPSAVRIITPNYPSPPPSRSFHNLSSSLIRILPQFSTSCDVSQQFVDWTGHRRHLGLTTNLSSKYNATKTSRYLHLHVNPQCPMQKQYRHHMLPLWIPIRTLSQWKRLWLMKVLCQCVWHIVTRREVILQILQMAPFILQLISLWWNLWS